MGRFMLNIAGAVALAGSLALMAGTGPALAEAGISVLVNQAKILDRKSVV